MSAVREYASARFGPVHGHQLRAELRPYRDRFAEVAL